jgi:hypothetical protein
LHVQKLTKVLEAVGVRVTPLSQASRMDLEKLDKEEEQQQQGDGSMAGLGRKGPVNVAHTATPSTLSEQPSTIIERLEGLLAERTRKDDDEEEEEEEEGEECITLRSHRGRKQADPLGANDDSD